MLKKRTTGNVEGLLAKKGRASGGYSVAASKWFTQDHMQQYLASIRRSYSGLKFFGATMDGIRGAEQENLFIA